jgi:hypothetical protein
LYVETFIHFQIIYTTRQIFTYFALTNAEKSLPPTPEVIEDSYCTISKEK